MKKDADLLFVNGTIYTVDSTFKIVNAVAVSDGKIVFAGDEKEARNRFNAKQIIDLKGKFMYPGLIDAHCHFYNYAQAMIEADLTGTKSWDDVLGKVDEHAKLNPDGWLIGRGWDQNAWEIKQFPTREKLDALFPDRPVVLVRVDGHALIANKVALDLAKVTAATKVDGGKIILKDGKPTGVLIDNAEEFEEKVIPGTSTEEIVTLLLKAQGKCNAVGLTTLCDAGLSKSAIFLLDTLQKTGKLKMRIYAMIADNEKSKEYFFSAGPYQTDRLHVCSVKYYADGALGSRGACLKAPYSDDPSNSGLMLSDPAYFTVEAKRCYEHGFQMNTHCIGDSGNAVVLRAYAQVLKGKNDRRWRVEHSQVLDVNDIHLFGDNSIIPSIQTTHATSDMYWAKDRLGADRMKGAYAYKYLMEQNGLLANGSDFPVESINPLFGFYAAVTRKDQKGFPENGFQIENGLTREQALRGMTIWAAYAAFEDKIKGSIEPGKLADFVILDEDLMKAPAEGLFKIKVLQTWIGGEKVFGP